MMKTNTHSQSIMKFWKEREREWSEENNCPSHF